MVPIQRISLFILCFAGSLLQNPQIEAKSLRNWAKQNPGSARLIGGSFVVAASAVVQYNVLKHMPDQVKRMLAKYPGRVLLGAVIYASALGLVISKFFSAYCAQESEMHQTPPAVEELYEMSSRSQGRPARRDVQAAIAFANTMEFDVTALEVKNEDEVRRLRWLGSRHTAGAHMTKLEKKELDMLLQKYPFGHRKRSNPLAQDCLRAETSSGRSFLC